MWCTVFLVAASIYLYADSQRKKRAEKFPRTSVIKNFAFVWVLLALLGLYIITITSTSQPIFIAGNGVVEVLLLFYIILRGRNERSTAKRINRT